MADKGKRSTMCAAMRSPTPRAPRKERVPRLMVDEVLLAERLGLCEEWVDRSEQGGEWKEESLARDELPPFIHAAVGQYKVYDVEGHIRRLVEAGCLQPVLYFCLEELSPEAAAVREGRRRRPVPGEDGEFSPAAEREKERSLATREDMEAVRNTADAARRQIHGHQRELLLVADTKAVPLPTGMPTVPEDADDALSLLKESLTWVSRLADAYTAPFEKTLLKSKGLLYLTAYVLGHADATKVRGRRWKGVDKELAGLASLVSGRTWSPSGLREKLRKFRMDHERLYRLLVRILDELHRFHAGR